MDLLLGAGAVSLTALIYAYGFHLHHKRPAAGWTTGHWGSVFFMVVITCLISVGVGYLGKVALNPLTLVSADSVWSIPASLAAFAAAIFGVRRLTSGYSLIATAPVRTPPAATPKASNKPYAPRRRGKAA